MKNVFTTTIDDLNNGQRENVNLLLAGIDELRWKMRVKWLPQTADMCKATLEIFINIFSV